MHLLQYACPQCPPVSFAYDLCTVHRLWVQKLVAVFRSGFATTDSLLFPCGEVILRISVSSSHLNGIVFALQCLVSPFMQRIFDGWFNATCSPSFSCIRNINLKILFSIFGVVNLDFFRGVYPNFCLHPQFFWTI